MRGLVLCIAVVALAGCGGDDARPAAAPQPPRTGVAGCEMTAQAARRVYDLMASGGRESSRSTLVLRREPGAGDDDVLTRASPSPDPRRHVVVLLNRSGAETLGATATSGDERVDLRAAPGCGAVASVRNEGRYRVRFTIDGRQAGALSP